MTVRTSSARTSRPGFYTGVDTPPGDWTSVTNNLDAGTFMFVSDAGDGGSRVLEVDGVTASAPAHSYLRFAFPQGGKEANSYQQYTLDFDFRVLQSNLDYDAFGLLIFKPNTASGENGIAGYGPALHILSHQGTGTAVMKSVSNQPVKWHAAHVTMTRIGAGPTYNRTIAIDSTEVDESVGPHTIDVGSPTELWIGVFNADSNAGTSKAQFDNVVLRRTP